MESALNPSCPSLIMTYLDGGNGGRERINGRPLHPSLPPHSARFAALSPRH
jgi:hypothetical protein